MPDTYKGSPNSSGGYAWDIENLGSTSGYLGRMWNNLSGTTANNEYAAIEAEKARVHSSAEAQTARDFELYMSNTAYQRAVADMKAAGLNPAAIGGNAASTPSGQAASSVAAHAAAAGNGGFAGIVGAIAKVAIGQALKAKFSHSAEKAADNHELVTAKVSHMAQQEINSAKKADAAMLQARNGYLKAMKSGMRGKEHNLSNYDLLWKTMGE